MSDPREKKIAAIVDRHMEAMLDELEAKGIDAAAPAVAAQLQDQLSTLYFRLNRFDDARKALTKLGITTVDLSLLLPQATT